MVSEVQMVSEVMQPLKKKKKVFSGMSNIKAYHLKMFPILY